MTPIYECNKCHFTFTNNVEKHDSMACNELPQDNPFDGIYKLEKCTGELKPVLYVDDVINMLAVRMEEILDNDLGEPLNTVDGTVYSELQELIKQLTNTDISVLVKKEGTVNG